MFPVQGIFVCNVYAEFMLRTFLGVHQTKKSSFKLCTSLVSWFNFPARTSFHRTFQFVLDESRLMAHLQYTGYVSKMLGWYPRYPALSEGRCTVPWNSSNVFENPWRTISIFSPLKWAHHHHAGGQHWRVPISNLLLFAGQQVSLHLWSWGD